jgi:hypothetical protein
LNGDDLRRDPLEVRKATLASILTKARPGIRFNEHIEGDGPTVFAHACKLGLEGIVSKRKDSAEGQLRMAAFRQGLQNLFEAAGRDANFIVTPTPSDGGNCWPQLAARRSRGHSRRARISRRCGLPLGLWAATRPTPWHGGVSLHIGSTGVSVGRAGWSDRRASDFLPATTGVRVLSDAID